MSGIAYTCFIELICALILNQSLAQLDLVILHTNDVHARFEETDTMGGECIEGSPCFGGVARRATFIKKVIIVK